ncbi:hypothetical protein OZX73_05180 [Bifidobacterium sp. ESL0775]|uniref:hypothetical protein n=1 Tax=Bifidobacterium sp. ESL0775 TaxID=2983230 RepID=UPI0023F73EF7|nr:hypothetical protein [Bifidobacterium sp. ESL0775]WEV68684.1 hypothetical protein OZX73_05180 [Bifidobacterium sp. ESL0775]
MNTTYEQLSERFDNNDFDVINQNPEQAKRFYYVRSVSKQQQIRPLAENFGLDATLHTAEIVNEVFDSDDITVNDIKEFINQQYVLELENRELTQDELVTELSQLHSLDWGGSQADSLEKNIVHNYVDKLPRYRDICEAVEGRVFESMRGYTMTSWYNHWSSILIEDIFKQSEHITPTVGRIQKIDFFINDVPFDLKVTYFPKQYLEDCFRKLHEGSEIAQVKRQCRREHISVNPDGIPQRGLNEYLQNCLRERTRSEDAQDFIQNLDIKKRHFVEDAMQDSVSLERWLYEHQGERRFDAANRFYLILVNTNNMFESWKLKRNLDLLKTSINEKLEECIENGPDLIHFNWQNQQYTARCEILFITV